ncbi:heme-binding protein 2 isoform X2 [Hyalella azteca]|nr:heme-binding protein 2 isoform X2 [Hyalella azteca]XP_018027612.1 heme-binding protein 2 isoform X2 [Hyalella azteca]
MAGLVKGIKALLGDVETAPFTVTAEKEGYEERVYPARKWACTTMQGPERDSLVSPMFRKLFNYISGKNELNLRMDMTTPVATYIEPGAGPTCASTFTMSFFVPEEHQSSPPNGGPDVFVQERPELTVLTRRFGGYAPDEAVAKEAKELAELLQAAGETDVDFTHYYVVGYDPPFKPINRRNEIWFIKKSKPASPSE